MFCHSNNLRNNGNPGPFNPKRLRQLPQVDSGCFPDAINGISQPRHAQGAQLLVKELLPELSRKERHVLDNGLSYTP